jgi:hypothetical protein
MPTSSWRAPQCNTITGSDNGSSGGGNDDDDDVGERPVQLIHCHDQSAVWLSKEP